jgi:hypothetical protein
MGYKLTWAYIWNQKVRPSGWWTPPATCVAYYPLEDDFLDYSWNGYDLTNSWIVLGTTTDGYKAWQLGVNKFAYTTAFNFQLTNSTPRTIAFWEWCSSITAGSWSMAAIMKSYTSWQNACFWAITYVYSTLWWMWDPRFQDSWWSSTTQPIDYNMSLIDANQMHSYVFAVDSSWASWYKDGVLIGSATANYSGTYTWFVIGNNKSTDPSRNLDWYIRQVVIDAWLRTAQDVLNYHNWTA